MRFASIGDCCIDTYPNKKVLGGTAYNSAVVAQKYGAETSLISAIGDDANGKLYQQALQEQDINRTHLQITSASTSTIDVTLDEHSSPIFGPWDLGALRNWELTHEDLDFIKQHDIAKTICLRPMEKVFQTFCSTSMPYTLKVGDFNGNSTYTSFTPNEIAAYADGLDILVKSINGKDTEIIDSLKMLSDEKNKIVLLTLGSKGSICFANHQTYIQEAVELQVTNTTGFGDAYIAVFLLTYFKTKNIQQAMSEATSAVTHLPQS